MSDNATSNGTNVTELRAKARKQMDEAIQCIPAERKAEYLVALEKAPYLFESETDPLMFLRVCDYNVWAAAERLVLYWKERTEIFGPDRAYLPLVLTGDGALNEDDILSLRAGYPNLLPESKSGHPVVYSDRRLHLPHLPAVHRLRGLLYMAHKISEQYEIAQTEGIIYLVSLITPRAQNFDSYFVKKSLWLAFHVVPVKVLHIHGLSSPPKHKNVMIKRYMIQDLFQYILELYLRENVMVDVHFDRGGGEVFETLVGEVGLLPCSIPKEFGGTWDQTQSSAWCRRQVSIEREQYKWLLQAVKKEKPVAIEKTTEENKEVQKRAKNACNSRYKRARKRKFEETLIRQHRELVLEHETLIAEHTRLEKLLKQAHNVAL